MNNQYGFGNLDDIFVDEDNLVIYQSADDRLFDEDEHSPQRHMDQKPQFGNNMENSNAASNFSESESIRKLFVGGISSNITGDVLRDYYSKFGAVVDAFVPQDKETSAYRRFGFVTFASLSDIDSVMKNRPHIINGQTVLSKRAIPREKAKLGQKDVESFRLFIGGITEEHTESSIKNYFNQFGNVTSIDFITDKVSGKPCNYCFVNFDDYDPVDKCTLVGPHILSGSKLRVERALPRDQHFRKQQLSRDREDRGSRSRGPYSSQRSRNREDRGSRSRGPYSSQRSRDREDRGSRSRIPYSPQRSRNSGSGRFRESYNDDLMRGRRSFRERQFDNAYSSNTGSSAIFNRRDRLSAINSGSNILRRNPIGDRGQNRLGDGDLHGSSRIYDESSRKRLSEEFEAPTNPRESRIWSTGSHLTNQPPPWSVQQPMYGQNSRNDQQHVYERREWSDQQPMYGRPNLPKQPRYESRY